ncbi:Nucleoside phosphorylase [Nitrosospira multiformis ATCC 25196]|uniref:Nucleoside phosphorylase n=1 Tax=Nitrosospira multiformis (strain ATCC 25196 / NCIMB 11849 / C 71) TaxID=323848 RepID=Q2YBM1_NITMU|nr:response regulator [Nitrosospira multiformis]ABB73850.1 response regulator receiver domain protein (CheY-like) [Nitrosospira multiformis ATCC 25196]SEF43376.1 Nucleoside phosphorylase [Nitrosospira multiformis ATCC 25196]
MKILIVDDEYRKVEEIFNVLADAGISCAGVKHETTAQAARILLRRQDYDLLIIDLHLPAAIGGKPDNEGGITFLDMIRLDEKVKLPASVLFITGREELIESAYTKVIERGAILCQYHSDSDEWKKILIGRAKYDSQRLARDEQVDVVIVTALRNPELDAVLNLPYQWIQKRIKDDPLTYHYGKIPRIDSNISVVAVSPNRKGMPSSAAVASKLALMFKPKILLMVGICAGIRDKCSLGDIIVADPTWDWGSGKHGLDSNGSPVFHAAPRQVPLNSALSQVASDLANDESVMNGIRKGWSEEVPGGKLKVHIGPMASGASVIADDRSARLIAIQQHRELIAIEMEAYAVMAAAEYTSIPNLTAMIIKSVCDFADAEKNDTWQKYASYTSAAFADQLFRNSNISV